MLFRELDQCFGVSKKHLFLLHFLHFCKKTLKEKNLNSIWNAHKTQMLVKIYNTHHILINFELKTKFNNSKVLQLSALKSWGWWLWVFSLSRIQSFWNVLSSPWKWVILTSTLPPTVQPHIKSRPRSTFASFPYFLVTRSNPFLFVCWPWGSLNKVPNHSEDRLNQFNVITSY